MTNRENEIERLKRKLKMDLDAAKEAVADTIAKMSNGAPGNFAYQIAWGRGISEDLSSAFLAEALDRVESFERGELKEIRSYEQLATVHRDAAAEKAMRVEHSSSYFSNAVSIARQDVARGMWERWKWFLLSLESATEQDRQLAAEAKAGIERTSIEAERRVVNAAADSPEEAKVSRKLLAAMRAKLKEHNLGETSHQGEKFWVRRATSEVLGIVRKDELKIAEPA